jgi:probable HAF family extracellular repeat protein
MRPASAALAVLALSFVLALPVPAVAQASATYQLIDLGTLGGTACPPPTGINPGLEKKSLGFALNGRGQAAGSSCFQPFLSSSVMRAFRWSVGTMTNLGALGTTDNSAAYGMNDSGQVVGEVYASPAPGTAFLWSAGTATSLAPVLGGFSAAYDVSNSGKIVGIRGTPPAIDRWGAFLYDTASGQVTTLPSLGGTFRVVASALNEDGAIAGYSSTLGDSAFHAVRWTNGTPLDLGTLGGTHSYGWAINASGDVVGESWVAGDEESHAFLYSGGSMKDLGTLGGKGSSARGINDSGVVVGAAGTAASGSHAFVHDGTTMRDLNDLIPPGSGWVLTEGRAINAVGEIVGTGRFGFEDRAFILTPGQAFFTLTPCRLLDTRDADGPFGGPALAAGGTRSFVLAGNCAIPADARAVSVNLTVTAATTNGNLRAYPAGAPEPLTSAINYAPGQTRANNAVLSLGAGGDLTVRCSQATGTVHLVIDVNGYYLTPPAGAADGLRP